MLYRLLKLLKNNKDITPFFKEYKKDFYRFLSYNILHYDMAGNDITNQILLKIIRMLGENAFVELSEEPEIIKYIFYNPYIAKRINLFFFNFEDVLTVLLNKEEYSTLLVIINFLKTNPIVYYKHIKRIYSRIKKDELLFLYSIIGMHKIKGLNDKRIEKYIKKLREIPIKGVIRDISIEEFNDKEWKKIELSPVQDYISRIQIRDYITAYSFKPYKIKDDNYYYRLLEIINFPRDLKLGTEYLGILMSRLRNPEHIRAKIKIK